MNDANRKSHWETVYTTRGENEVSWFQEDPALSLELIDLARTTPDSAIIDIGGGASRLVDSLIARGFRHVTVLDISQAALDAARRGSANARAMWNGSSPMSPNGLRCKASTSGMTGPPSIF